MQALTPEQIKELRTLMGECVAGPLTVGPDDYHGLPDYIMANADRTVSLRCARAEHCPGLNIKILQELRYCAALRNHALALIDAAERAENWKAEAMLAREWRNADADAECNPNHAHLQQHANKLAIALHLAASKNDQPSSALSNPPAQGETQP